MRRPSRRRARVSERRWSARRWGISRRGRSWRRVAGNGETRQVTARRADREPEGPARIGVLALQGDVREHAEILKKLGVEPVEVRGAEDLAGLAGLIVPGGEGTAIGSLMVDSGLL